MIELNFSSSRMKQTIWASSLRWKGKGKREFGRVCFHALIPFPFPFERLPCRLACVADASLLGQRKKSWGCAEGEKERRPPLPSACSCCMAFDKVIIFYYLCLLCRLMSSLLTRKELSSHTNNSGYHLISSDPLLSNRPIYNHECPPNIDNREIPFVGNNRNRLTIIIMD